MIFMTGMTTSASGDRLINGLLSIRTAHDGTVPVVPVP